jgi:hypothetical protein
MSEAPPPPPANAASAPRPEEDDDDGGIRTVVDSKNGLRNNRITPVRIAVPNVIL